MVVITRLNGKEIFINPDLIEFMEETPDTVITLTTGRKLVATEKAEVLIERIVEFRQKVFVRLPVCLKSSDFPETRETTGSPD